MISTRTPEIGFDSTVYSIAVVVYGESLLPRETKKKNIPEHDNSIKIISKGYHPSMDYNRLGLRIDLKA